MKITDIEIGVVYRNKRGLCRKVKGFYSDWKGEITMDIPERYIGYVKCDDGGNEKGTIQTCWSSTFSGWAKDQLETDGKTPIERATQYALRLKEMGSVTEANAIQTAFKLYGVKMIFD